MNTSPSEIHLRLQAADDLSEIFLADNHFQLLGSGVGVLDIQVPPGIYKARFRAGQQQEDQLIEVPAEPASQRIQGPAVEFYTPLPLEGQDPKQQQAASEHSHRVTAHVGNGSWLYFFLRGLTKEASRPWAGISLHDLRGKLLFKASHGIRETRQRFWALNVELDPGTYRLRLQVEAGQTYEIFVVTLLGWQSQFFALSESGWLPGIKVHRAALASASILMAEAGKGFDPADPSLRQRELLRLGCSNRRKILTEAGLNTLLHAQDPMTALFVLHLLRDQEEEGWTAQFIARWQDILAPHPDFQALCLHQGREDTALWSQPPMLYPSWQLMLEAITEKKASFAPDSLNEEIQKTVVQTALWLLHRL